MSALDNGKLARIAAAFTLGGYWMRFAWVAALPLLIVTGCTQQVNYVMSEYGSTAVEEYVEPASGESFRIFYNAGASKLMITPSLGRSFQNGATFGAAELPASEVYAAVAMSWLKSKGRDCKSLSSVSVLDAQHEVVFSCAYP